MPFKKIYFSIIIIIALSFLNIAHAQIQINSSSLNLCTSNSGFFFVQNSIHPNSTYQWQDSTAIGWSNISNTNNFIGVTNDTLFLFNVNTSLNNLKVRCIIDSAALNIRKDTTRAGLITIYSPIVAPKIKKSQSICYNASPDSILATQAASGADANFIYQWQLAKTLTSWTDIPGADSLSLSIQNLVDSVYYFRLRATSLFGCGIAYSDTIKVNVYNSFKKPLISANQIICYNTIPQKLNLLGYKNSVDDKFNYQWQSSFDAINFNDIINKTDTQLIFNQSLTSSLYYRLKVTSISGCGIQFSDTVFIKVLPNIIRPVISSNQILCYNGTPDTLRMTQRAKGADSLFTYNWQESLNGINWLLINNATDTFLKLNNQSTTKYFRIAAYNSCDTIFSDSIKITVYPILNAGIIRNSQSICYNASPQVLSFQTLPSGADGMYSYNWQVSADSINFNDIVGANTSIFQPPLLTNTRYYRLKVTSDFGCGIDYTNIVKIFVYDQFIAAQISTNTDTVCYGYTTDTLFISNFPKGANGVYSYQWQSSTDNVNWTNINLANGTKYISNRLFQTTFYRVLVASNCGLLNSNVIKVFVFTNITKPVLSIKQTICYNTAPDTIRVVVPASGADNKFTYSWYQSSNGINWTLIPNANLLKYNPGKLTSSTYYKVLAQNSYSCFRYSDSVYINVYNEFKAGVISSNQIVCFMNESDTLRFNQLPSGAGESFALQWQVSTDSINFTNIIASTGQKFKAPKSDHTKFYRVRVTSNLGCGILFTNIIRIKVYDKFIGAVISGNDTICKDSIPNELISIALPQGGNLQYSYQWQFSNDLLSWINIPNATSNSYQPGELLSTTYYRLLNFSGMNCGFDTSNFITIKVLDLPDTTEIVGYTEVCKNQQELFYKLNKTNDQYSYRWFVNKAEILTNNQSNAIFLNWSEQTGFDTIRVLQFNKVTGCYNYMLLPIIIKEDRAPNKTKIIRKSNTNILVCQDSTVGLTYQWGYIEKGITTMHDIPNANLRYVLLPHNFDTTRYVYYVRTIYTGCATNTFYNYYDPLIFNSVHDQKIEVNIFPNPSNGKFKISGFDNKKISISIYDVLGKQQSYDFHENEISLNNANPGVYFVIVYHNNKKYTKRIVIK